MDIIIGMLSAENYTRRRAACVETWVKRAEKLGVTAVFIVGDINSTDIKRVGRCLFVPCNDRRNFLTHKTALFCKWAINIDGWDYLFKCDDDTYVHIDRLIEFDAGGHDYIGAEVRQKGYGNGGAGYLLSRRAAKIVADGLINIKGSGEDKFVGAVLAEHGIKLYNSNRFKSWRFHNAWPSNNNDTITAHCIDPDMMHVIHSSIYK